MGPRYFLDTNIVIYYLEGLLTPPGKVFLKKVIEDNAHISIISKIELLGWSPPEGSEISNVLKSSIVYGLDDQVADYTVYIRRTYRRLKLPDAVIAAACISYNFDLITRDTAHFSLVKELRIVNPFEL